MITITQKDGKYLQCGTCDNCIRVEKANKGFICKNLKQVCRMHLIAEGRY